MNPLCLWFSHLETASKGASPVLPNELGLFRTGSLSQCMHPASGDMADTTGRDLSDDPDRLFGEASGEPTDVLFGSS